MDTKRTRIKIKGGRSISSNLGGIEKSFKKPETPIIRVNISQTNSTIIAAEILLRVSSNGKLSLLPQAYTAIMIKNAIPKTNAIKSAEMCNGMYGMYASLLNGGNIKLTKNNVNFSFQPGHGYGNVNSRQGKKKPRNNPRLHFVSITKPI